MRSARDAVVPWDVCRRDEGFGHVAKLPGIANRLRRDEARMHDFLPALNVRRILMLLQHFLAGRAVTGLVAGVGFEHQIVSPRFGTGSLRESEASLVVGGRLIPESQIRI